MPGFLFAVVAGAAMSIQGVMNTRLGEHMGVLEANVYVQMTGLILSILIACFFGKGSWQQLGQAPWYSWLGGILAPVITVTVMLSIQALSPTVSISTILIAQLFVAALIDAMGIMGAKPVAFTWQKWVGLALMTGGVILMKIQK